MPTGNPTPVRIGITMAVTFAPTLDLDLNL
jgi:hypothetical protein